MRIAFIGQKGIPAISGGVEKHVESIAIRMAQAGHEVFVYARGHYTDPQMKEYKGVHIIHLPSIRTKNLDAITHTFLATIHALFCRYDVIHYQSIGPSALSFIPKLLKWRTKIVATFHCQDYYHKKWNWFAKLFLRMGEYVTCSIPDQVIVVSRGLQQYVKEKYGKETILIPNGADVIENVGSDILDQFHIKEKRYILSVGRLVKHKGVHYLIKAFQQLEDTNKMPNNFKLVIVGKEAETLEYEKYLQVISEGRENIVFLGEQTGEALRQLFANAYAFVQPSESEGLSIALLEAMSYGVVPVVSDIEANLEAIGETGLTFPSKRIDDLRDTLAFVLNRSDEARRLGVAAKERIAQEYSWESATSKTLALYANMTDAGRYTGSRTDLLTMTK